MHRWLSVFKIGNKSGPNVTQTGRIVLGQLHVFAFGAQYDSDGFEVGNLNPSFAVMLIYLCHCFFTERDKIKK